MWRLVTDISKGQPNMKFAPELWVRKEGMHNFGTGRCWEYVVGTTAIDESKTIIDVVNVVNRVDYIVAAVREDEKDIPVPIGRQMHNAI
jgi:hypothetical protein